MTRLQRMVGHNKRLTPELALHLARHAVRLNDDGSYSWKYDPYQAMRAPYGCQRSDYIGLWSRIACPTLLLCAGESFIPDVAKAGILRHFKYADHQVVEGAGHWLQHDRADEVIATLQRFLQIAGESAGRSSERRGP